MDGSSNRSSKEASTGKLSRANDSTRVISIEQLQHLVRLLDSSDVSELELKRAAEGIRLVLRKVKLPENSDQSPGSQYVRPTSNAADNVAPAASPKETEHKVVAPFVGTFHVWAKPKGGTLVAVGDRVKAGQLVGTIQRRIWAVAYDYRWLRGGIDAIFRRAIRLKRFTGVTLSERTPGDGRDIAGRMGPG